MVMFYEGLNRIADLIDIDITRGQLGTDSTAPDESQTALIAPVAATLYNVTSSVTYATESSPSALIVKNFVLSASTGTGETYYEYGNRSASADDVDYDRHVINPNSGYAHTDTKQLTIIKRYFVRNN